MRYISRARWSAALQISAAIGDLHLVALGGLTGGHCSAHLPIASAAAGGSAGVEEAVEQHRDPAVRADLERVRRQRRPAGVREADLRVVECGPDLSMC